MGPPLKWEGKLVAKDIARVLTAFFISIFTDKIGVQKSQAPETSRKVWRNENLPWVDKDHVRNI